MKAFIDQQVVEIPDAAACDERVLIRTQLVGCHESASSDRMTVGRALSMIVDRLDQIVVTLAHDGVRALTQKASHMFRREKLSFEHQFCSFVGEVVEDRTEQPLPPGTRVAGFALTHPAATELVLTRKEHLWHIPTDTPATLSAMSLFGGCAIAAIKQAQKLATSRVGVAGNGLLAEIVEALLLEHNLQPVIPNKNEGSHQDTPIWIAAGAVPKKFGAKINTLIGCGWQENELRRTFPNAEQYHPLSIRSLIANEQNFVDLFYFDGPCRYDDWFQLGDVDDYVTRLPSLAAKLESQLSAADASDVGRNFLSFDADVTDKNVHPAKKSSSSNQLNVGLIGGGRFPLGMIVRHMERHPDVALRGVCDRRPEVAFLAGKALGFDHTTTNPNEIINDANTDVVVVAPYHGMHAPFAAAALNAGKHCFVEKPPAINQQQLAVLADAVQSTDRILHVGYNRRFAPLNDVLRKHLEEQDGPLAMNFVMRSIDIPQNNWYYWPSNGNRIISNICHLIDYACYLVYPHLPTAVTTTITDKQRPDENVVVNVNFADGSIANILYTNRGAVRRGYYQRYTVARGEMIAEFDFRTLEIRNNSRRVARWRGVEDVGHRPQVNAFLHAIQTGSPPPVSLAETLVSAKTVLSAAESAELGTCVQLNFEEFAAARSAA